MGLLGGFGQVSLAHRYFPQAAQIAKDYAGAHALDLKMLPGET
jgi:hypothetical protein